MYETFFGLTERPFTLRPDPSFLYLSRHHSLALSMLEFGLTGQAGFVMVTGEVGAGKTTLIRHVLKRDIPTRPSESSPIPMPVSATSSNGRARR